MKFAGTLLPLMMSLQFIFLSYTKVVYAGYGLEEVAQVLFQSGRMYDQSELYQYLQSLDVTEVKGLIEQWYPQSSQQLMDKVLSNLGNNYLGLLADPGIVSRIDDFLIFAKPFTASHPNAELFAIRSAYSERLGSQIVYRALSLTENERMAIEKDGLHPPGAFYHQEKTLEAYERVLGKINESQVQFAKGPVEEVSNRLTFWDYRTRLMFQSSTKYPEIAIALAAWIKRFEDPNSEKKSVYLFELELPALSLILKEGPFQRSEESGNCGSKYFRVSGKRFKIHYLDRGAEIFIPHKIQVSQIRKITRVSDLSDYVHSWSDESESYAADLNPGKQRSFSTSASCSIL